MMALIQCLADRYEQHVVLRRGSGLHRRLAEPQWHSLRLRPVSNSVPAAVRASGGVDLLHVHEGRSVQVGALRSLLGTPFVVTRRVPNRPRENFAMRWCYRRARIVVGVSDAVAEIMHDYTGSDAIETIRDLTPRIPIDSDKAAALRARLAGKIVVGHVGELHDAHKGQLVILEAARMAVAAHPELYFLLVGGGKDEQSLRQQAEDLPNVEFVGRVDRVGDYYAAMDLFIFPSREEALGSAILEAMSCGLPVIASDIGGIPEIVKPDQNGVLFPVADAAAMLEAIVRLAADSALRERLAAGAKATAQARRAELAAADYVSVYERALRP